MEDFLGIGVFGCESVPTVKDSNGFFGNFLQAPAPSLMSKRRHNMDARDIIFLNNVYPCSKLELLKM
jgi:hypothetical protein